MLFRNDDSDSDSYLDRDTRRMIFWIKFKGFMAKFLFVVVLLGAFVLYSFAADSSKSEAMNHVRDVNRVEATREAIELYSNAHPEFTEEEIELIFRGIAH